jgi:oligoendopeptidase F
MGALLAVYLYTEFQGEFADAVSRYYGMLSSGSSTADEVIVLAGISDLM